MHRLFRPLAGLFALASILAFAPRPYAADAETKAADKLIERWIDASGGSRRIKAQKGVQYRVRSTTNGFSWEGTVLSWPDGRFHLAVSLPNGDYVEADDGKTAWRRHSAMGSGLFSDADVRRHRRSRVPLLLARLREEYPVRRRLPDADVAGRQLQVVEMHARTDGDIEKWFFDPATSFRVRMEQRQDGKTRTTDFSDFRKIDGMIEAFKAKTTSEEGQLEVELLGINRKPALDPKLLVPPAGLVDEARGVEKLFARSVEVSGGEERIRATKSRITRARIEIVTAGIHFDSTLYQDAQGRVLVEQEVPGMGRVLQGYDGTTAWAWAELQGYRELQGPEKAQVMGMADLLAPLKSGELMPLRKRLPDEMIDGRPVAVVDAGNATASAGRFFFDLASGHIRRVETHVVAGPGGTLKIVADMSDFRTVDGHSLAFAVTATNPAMKIVTKLLEVRHDAELPVEMFKPRKTGEAPAL